MSNNLEQPLDSNNIQDPCKDDNVDIESMPHFQSIGAKYEVEPFPIDEDNNAGGEHSSNASATSNNTPTPTPTDLGYRPGTKAPKETLKAVYAAGRYKADLKLDVVVIQSFMAGVYIASACQLLQSVGGGFVGAAIFPIGLLAIVLTSSELFTGDALIFVASVLGREVKVTSLLRNWSVEWVGNFIGSALWAFIFGYLSHALNDLGQKELAISMAETKANNELYSIFIKGMGANFLVCVGIWSATCAEEVAGKVLALWFPIMGFVVMGFDHCVANMYLIPVGMMLGADITVGRMFLVIIVTSLGNMIGGGIFVGAVYWYVFDTMQSQNIAYASITKVFTGKNFLSSQDNGGRGGNFKARLRRNIPKTSSHSD